MVIHGSLGKVAEDDRRRIFEFNGPHFSVSYFDNIYHTVVLANHFHRNKSETFLITNGGGIVYVQNVDGEGKLVPATEQILLLHTNSVVQIPPYTYHRFELDPSTTMVCYSNKPYNKLDDVLIQN